MSKQNSQYFFLFTMPMFIKIFWEFPTIIKYIEKVSVTVAKCSIVRMFLQECLIPMELHLVRVHTSTANWMLGRWASKCLKSMGGLLLTSVELEFHSVSDGRHCEIFSNGICLLNMTKFLPSTHGFPFLCSTSSFLTCAVQPWLRSRASLPLSRVLSQRLTGTLLSFSIHYAAYFTMKIHNLGRAYGSDSNWRLHLILM